MMKSLLRRKSRIPIYTLVTLAVMLSVTMVTGFYLETDKTFAEMSSKDFVVWFFCCIALSIICFVLVDGVYRCVEITALREKTNGVKKTPIGEKKQFLVYWCAILICWLPVWLAFYPVSFTYDVVAQVYQLGYGHLYSDSPLLHTFWVALCWGIGAWMGNPNAGMMIYSLTQMTIMSAIFAYTFVFVMKHTGNMVLRVVTFLFYALFPTNALFSFTTAKDTVFSGLVLFCIVRFIEINEDGREKTEGAAKDVLLMVCAVFMMLFRKNALWTMVIVFLHGLRKKSMRKVQLISVCVILIEGLFFNYSLERILNAGSGKISEAMSLPMQQFGRIWAYGDEEDLTIIKKHFNMDEASYYPPLSDPMKKEFRSDDLTGFLMDSARLAVKHPLITIDAMLYLNKGAWYLFDTSHAEVYTASESRHLFPLTVITGHGVTRDSKIPLIEKFFNNFISSYGAFEIPVIRVLFFPAFWCWVFIFCAIGWSVYGDRKYALCTDFLWVQYVMILASPCILTRYVYPLIVCAPVLAVMIPRLAADKKKSFVSPA